MSFLKKGKEVEAIFAQYLSNFGNVSEANPYQDMNEHWDVALEDIKFDVKGLRKKNRHDEDFDENIHWIEMQNVHGNVGWLYGEADFIAFESIDYWIIVKRTSLIKLIDKKCTDKENFYTRPELYKFYRRSNREDMITLVKTIDLCKISDVILSKDISEYSPKQIKSILEKLNKKANKVFTNI